MTRLAAGREGLASPRDARDGKRAQSSPGQPSRPPDRQVTAQSPAVAEADLSVAAAKVAKPSQPSQIPWSQLLTPQQSALQQLGQPTQQPDQSSRLLTEQLNQPGLPSTHLRHPQQQPPVVEYLA